MRIEEEYVEMGCFWLPEQAENKIPGTLTVKDGGNIELEVMGSFDQSIQSRARDDDISRIIGHVEKDILVTLDGCFYTKWNMLPSPMSKAKIRVNRLLRRVGYGKNEKVTFNTLSFSVDCMDEWVGISGINVDNDCENWTTTISYNPPKNIVHVLGNGILLKICFAHTIDLPNRTEAKITQRACFKLESEELRPLNDFTKIADKLTQLMCFAIDATVTLKNLSATSEEIHREDGEGNTYPISVDIYYPSTPYSEKVPNKSWHQMLFNYSEIKSSAQDVFKNWINAYEILSPAISLYFSTKVDAQKYFEEKFLALAKGLETFDRSMNGNKMNDHKIYFKERLERIIEPFESRLGDCNEGNNLLRKIVDTRNYLTHYNERLKDKAAEGQELWKLCQIMEIIFQLHFLKVIGLSDKEMNSVVENHYPLKKKINDLNSQ